MDSSTHLQSPGIPGAEKVAEGLWLLAGRPRHKLNVYVMGDVLVDSASRHAAGRILRQTAGLELSAHGGAFASSWPARSSAERLARRWVARR